MQERASALAALTAAIAVLFAGCQRDRFECGTVAPSGDAPRMCDRAGEVCICSQHRCARYDGTCPSTYGYVFEDGGDANDGCVPPEDARSALDQQAAQGDLRYCPGEVARPPQCGVSSGGNTLKCSGADVCFCSTKQCARHDATCPSGWEWSFGQTCVPSPVDLAKELPNRDTGLCADQVPPPALYPDDCGKADSTGQPRRCGANQVCVCSTTSCAAPDPGCQPEGTSHLRYVQSGLCVEDASIVTPDAATGFCPGWSVP